jgi:hypothetical protein
MLHVGRRDYAKAEELYRRALQASDGGARDDWMTGDDGISDGWISESVMD